MTQEDRRTSKRMLKGVQYAVARALERHKRLGESVAVWSKGRVVVIRPEQKPTIRKRKRDCLSASVATGSSIPLGLKSEQLGVEPSGSDKLLMRSLLDHLAVL